MSAPVFKGFDDWYGADVAVATGWDTAYPAALLPNCRARAYLINDHEPEFFATSAESLWAERTYELGPLRHLARAAGCATCSRAATDSAAAGSGSASTTRLPARRPGAPARHGHLLRAQLHAPAGGSARRARTRGAAPPAPGHRASCCSASASSSTCRSLRAAWDREPETLARAYSRGHGRPLPVADQLLADPPGDAGLWAAVRGPGGRKQEAELGRDGAWSWPTRIPSRSPTRSNCSSTTARAGSSDPPRGLAQVEDASWEGAARQVETGLREALREREHAPTLK